MGVGHDLHNVLHCLARALRERHAVVQALGALPGLVHCARDAGALVRGGRLTGKAPALRAPLLSAGQAPGGRRGSTPKAGPRGAALQRQVGASTCRQAHRSSTQSAVEGATVSVPVQGNKPAGLRGACDRPTRALLTAKFDSNTSVDTRPRASCQLDESARQKAWRESATSASCALAAGAAHSRKLSYTQLQDNYRMGGGNGQKSATARARKQEQEKKLKGGGAPCSLLFALAPLAA